MEYNKLFRDNIPEIIKEKNSIPLIHTSSEEEYWKKLKEKLQEEVDEFNEDGNEEELADILEIIYAICDFKNIDKNTLENLRKEKADSKGRFKDRMILDEIKE